MIINYDEVLLDKRIFLSKVRNDRNGDLYIYFYEPDLYNVAVFFEEIKITKYFESYENGTNPLMSYTFSYHELLNYINILPETCNRISRFDPVFEKMYKLKLKTIKLKKIRRKIENKI